MFEYLTEHAGFVVIASFVLYSIGIYKLVDVIKKMTADVSALKRFRVAMAVVIGGVTGPFIYPYLFELLGVTVGVPILFSVLLGIGAGGGAVNIHNYVNRKLNKDNSE